MKTLRQYGKTTYGDWPGPIIRAIQNGEEFKSGAMVATKLDGNLVHPHPGRLEGPTALRWHRELHQDRIDYVVWSYATPIAWRLKDGTWVAPLDKYSPTTSRHQRFVYLAVG